MLFLHNQIHEHPDGLLKAGDVPFGVECLAPLGRREHIWKYPRAEVL